MSVLSWSGYKIIASKNPIITDQEYIALQTNTTENHYANRNVKISDVTYRDFKSLGCSNIRSRQECNRWNENRAMV
ncbi:hypothetical protein L484_000270 [Morus notabilis]|uniref:Uncharacterized protein n=1 Tax=Morus notabilis TaxID=981085 RepID=W9SDM7_9ROSA|nr:hypothetical protein L484_000270 [Morus notabilis]